MARSGDDAEKRVVFAQRHRQARCACPRHCGSAAEDRSDRPRQHIDDVDECASREQLAERRRCAGGRYPCRRTSANAVGQRRASRPHAKRLAVVEFEDSRERAPQSRVRLFQDRVEHRREVAGRGVDDLQHLGGRGLLLQGLARLGDQPRVLHRDHRLRREVLQQRDLLVGERPDLLAVGSDTAEQASSLRSAHQTAGAYAAERRPRRGDECRRYASAARHVGDVDDRSPSSEPPGAAASAAVGPLRRRNRSERLGSAAGRNGAEASPS